LTIKAQATAIKIPRRRKVGAKSDNRKKGEVIIRGIKNKEELSWGMVLASSKVVKVPMAGGMRVGKKLTSDKSKGSNG
jgi:hypothetical protein